jgi:hypothetical protein
MAIEIERYLDISMQAQDGCAEAKEIINTYRRMIIRNMNLMLKK